MNKKGFTLVELLAVIVILGVISTIVFPAVNYMINESRENLYNIQIADLKKSAEKWAIENRNLLDKNHLNATYLTLNLLKQESYIEKTTIKNPKTKEDMNGCLEIKYKDNGEYGYEYYDLTCYELSESSEISNMHGYIRDYQDNELKITDVNLIYSAGEKILKTYENLISYEGGTVQGLYDIGDNYVFRGEDPKNYVRFNGSNELWRIISIDKKTNSLKLIKATMIASNQWDSLGGIAFENATVRSEILNNYSESNTAFAAIKNLILEDAIWNVGVVSNIDSNWNIIKSLEKSSTMVNNIGLINISDYILASLDSECIKDGSSNTCSNQNYLSKLFSGTTWTLNSNGEQIWVVSSGNPLLTPSTNLFNINPVIIGKPSIYITNEITDTVGTSGNPYILN